MRAFHPSRLIPSVACLLLGLSASGCFRYIPAQIEATPPGQGVRVLVTDRGAAEVAEVTDVDPLVPMVNGTLVGTEGSDLLVRVNVGSRRDGFVQSQINQTVRVPMGEVVSFQRREVDGLKTGLLIGAGAAVVGVVVAFIIDPFGSRDPPPGPDPEDLRFRLFSIPIG